MATIIRIYGTTLRGIPASERKISYIYPLDNSILYKPRTVALYGFDPGHFGIIRKERPRWGLSFLGAGDRDRTGTLFRARDFKSLVSACSTTPASIAYPNTFLPHRQANARSFCRFSQEAPLIFFSHLPLLSRR